MLFACYQTVKTGETIGYLSAYFLHFRNLVMLTLFIIRAYLI